MKNISKQNLEIYDLYHQYAEKYKGDFKASGYSFSSSWGIRKSLINYMVSFIDGSELDILDIGCNNGLTGRELCNSLNKKDISTNIDGVDFIDDATRIAKNDLGYRSTFVADVTDRQMLDGLLGDRQYQIVMCCEVFLYIHPKDYENFFKAIHSRLASGGRFLFVLPNIRSVYHLINKMISPTKFRYFFRYDYDLPLVHSLLGKYGFNIISSCGAEFFTDYKINLRNGNSRLKSFFSMELAILSEKA